MKVSRLAGIPRFPLLVAFVLPLVVAAAMVPLRGVFPVQDAALLLVLVIVAVSLQADRTAGVVAAVSAAVWFDFFLTRPYYRFSITDRSDVETTLLLLAIGVVITEVAIRAREDRASAARRADYLRGIQAAASALSAGSWSSAPAVQVTEQLTELLDLEACRFQAGVAGVGGPARLHSDGRVTLPRGERRSDNSLPAGMQTELLVRSGGLLQGRFLMSPKADAHPDLERRLVAIALADQFGALLAAPQHQLA